MFSNVKKWLAFMYLQYELSTCIYMFEPWEKTMISILFKYSTQIFPITRTERSFFIADVAYCPDSYSEIFAQCIYQQNCVNNVVQTVICISAIRKKINSSNSQFLHTELRIYCGRYTNIYNILSKCVDRIMIPIR